jgi:hypothetical protein
MDWLSSGRLRILVLRSWDQPIAPLRQALIAAGVDAELVRVDIEPALAAALDRRNVDVIAYAPETRGLPVAVVNGLLGDLGLEVPIVTFAEAEDIADVAARIASAAWRHAS